MLEYRVGMQAKNVKQGYGECMHCHEQYLRTSNRQRYCRTCGPKLSKQRHLEYLVENKEGVAKTAKKYRDRNEARLHRLREIYPSTMHGRAIIMLGSAKKHTRADVGRLPVTITVDLIEDMLKTTTHCPYCRVALTLKTKYPNTVSLDRIDPALGYSPSNVHIVCQRCNTKKADNNNMDLARFLYHNLKGDMKRISEMFDAVAMEKDVYPDASTSL